MSQTYRWYIFETTVPGDPNGPFAITSWSKTKDAARAKVDKADPKCELLAFKIFAASRPQAVKDAAEVVGVKVEGYISPADKRVGRQIVKAAVMRSIFCPFTGHVLDMRRAVVIDTTSRMYVMEATHWDEVTEQFRSHVGEEAFAKITVYDGRELFK